MDAGTSSIPVTSIKVRTPGLGSRLVLGCSWPSPSRGASTSRRSNRSKTLGGNAFERHGPSSLPSAVQSRKRTRQSITNQEGANKAP